MKKWLQNIFGITKMIEETKKTNALLDEIRRETKRVGDLSEAYNRAYHIRL